MGKTKDKNKNRQKEKGRSHWTRQEHREIKRSWKKNMRRKRYIKERIDRENMKDLSPKAHLNCLQAGVVEISEAGGSPAVDSGVYSRGLLTKELVSDAIPVSASRVLYQPDPKRDPGMSCDVSRNHNNYLEAKVMLDRCDRLPKQVTPTVGNGAVTITQVETDGFQAVRIILERCDKKLNQSKDKS